MLGPRSMLVPSAAYLLLWLGGFGLYLEVLRAYSWACAWGSLLVVLGD